MSRLHLIHEGSAQHVTERLSRLINACTALDVDCITHDSSRDDYTNVNGIEAGDSMYNVARGGMLLESLYINRGLNTFYIHKPLHATGDEDAATLAIVYQERGLSVPKSIFHSTCDRSLLREYVEVLQGFPIVVKVAGGTLGVGTMLASDFASLFSLTDYLVACNTRFYLRQYIRPREVARLIVVGSNVVASNQKLIAERDFRTSVKLERPLSKSYPIEAQALAIEATHAGNRETGGVDLLFDKDDRPYLLEVNMPHDFVTTEDVTRVDVARAMVDHLVSKAPK
jgi:hypothetical protein